MPASTTLDAIRDALVRQLYQPVRWSECVQALAVPAHAHRRVRPGQGADRPGQAHRQGAGCARAGTPGDLQAALDDWAVTA
jgi:[acyl-carrier-protein] S-malonyltransferase